MNDYYEFNPFEKMDEKSKSKIERLKQRDAKKIDKQNKKEEIQKLAPSGNIQVKNNKERRAINIVKTLIALAVLSIIVFIFLPFIIPSGSSNEDKEQEKAEINFCYMDEDLVIDNIHYNLYEASIQKSVPSTLGGEIDTEYYFMYIKIKITNNASSSKNFYLSDFTLRSPGGNAYEPTDYVYMYNRMKNAKLGAGFSETYYIVFEIPKKEMDGDYKLVIDEYWFANDPYIIINDWYSIYGE